MNKRLTIIAILALALVSAAPEELVRLTLINKSGMRIAVQLRSPFCRQQAQLGLKFGDLHQSAQPLGIACLCNLVPYCQEFVGHALQLRVNVVRRWGGFHYPSYLKNDLVRHIEIVSQGHQSPNPCRCPVDNLRDCVLCYSCPAASLCP